MKILNKILRQNNNIWQIVGAIIGSFMGLLLLLLSIQFYIDLNDLTESEDQFVNLIDKAIIEQIPEKIQKCMDVANSNTWGARVEQIWKIVEKKI